MQQGSPDAAPQTKLGLGLAIGWLVVGTLGCLSSVVLLLMPEVAANASLITVPIFVSGWGGIAGAMPTRTRGMPVALIAPAVGAALGFLVGVVGILGVYALAWPDFW